MGLGAKISYVAFWDVFDDIVFFGQGNEIILRLQKELRSSKAKVSTFSGLPL